MRNVNWTAHNRFAGAAALAVALVACSGENAASTQFRFESNGNGYTMYAAAKPQAAASTPSTPRFCYVSFDVAKTERDAIIGGSANAAALLALLKSKNIASINSRALSLTETAALMLSLSDRENYDWRDSETSLAFLGTLTEPNSHTTTEGQNAAETAAKAAAFRKALALLPANFGSEALGCGIADLEPKPSASPGTEQTTGQAPTATSTVTDSKVATGTRISSENGKTTKTETFGDGSSRVTVTNPDGSGTVSDTTAAGITTTKTILSPAQAAAQSAAQPAASEAPGTLKSLRLSDIMQALLRGVDVSGGYSEIAADPTRSAQVRSAGCGRDLERFRRCYAFDSGSVPPAGFTCSANKTDPACAVCVIHELRAAESCR